MPSLSSLAVLALPLLSYAAPHNGPPGMHRRATSFTLKDHFTGNDFIQKWDFFSGTDPTHGTVAYQTRENAISKGLVFVNSDGHAVLKVDNTSTLAAGVNRASVRISSPTQYTKALIIADIQKMPHGPTTWPAYWSLGPDWPNNGEIDVIEGVEDATTNQMTLHTKAGCTLDTSPQILSSITGKPRGSTDCESPGKDNSGCGIVDSAPGAYGHDFNTINGGVLAHLVDDTGIKIWRFPRTNIPADIPAQKPNPDAWGKPAAFFSTSTCNVDEHFKDHNLVFDTTICGDLGGLFPGGQKACIAAVGNPRNFDLASWVIGSIDAYDISS